MTRNQILYQEHLEKKRTNLANEKLTAARDSETARSNVARETETNRSNLARELETNRANVARETETNRSNLANELLRAKELSESVRTHLANESIGRTNAATNAAVAREQQRSNLAREFESNRSNVAHEQETNRSNLAKEAETNRHNVESENLQSTSNVLDYESRQYAADSRLAETLIQAETNKLVQQMREEGMNSRQIRQIGADALNVLHDDVVDLIKSGAGQSTINRIVDDFILREIRSQ